MPLIRASDGHCFASKVIVARSFLSRLQGLIARPPLTPDTVLHLIPCGSIHTWGMAYPLDVVFLDRTGVVLKTVLNLKPFRMAMGGVRAASALEWRAGVLSAKSPAVGDRLILEGPPDQCQ
jgi:uncharacterized membrane protein (UPF0127 family)